MPLYSHMLYHLSIYCMFERLQLSSDGSRRMIKSHEICRFGGENEKAAARGCVGAVVLCWVCAAAYWTHAVEGLQGRLLWTAHAWGGVYDLCSHGQLCRRRAINGNLILALLCLYVFIMVITF